MISPEDIRQAAYEAFELEYEELESLVPKHELDSAQKRIAELEFQLTKEAERYATLQQAAILARQEEIHQIMRANSLEAERDKLRDALQGIAHLIKSDEIMDSSLIDFLGGYDECIKHARKALAFEKRNVPLKQAVEELRAALDGEWIDETQGPANERL